MKIKFTQTTHICEHHFKSFSRVKSTQDEKVRLIKGNELKLTQDELLSFFFFKRVYPVPIRTLKVKRH